MNKILRLIKTAQIERDLLRTINDLRIALDTIEDTKDKPAPVKPYPDDTKP